MSAGGKVYSYNANGELMGVAGAGDSKVFAYNAFGYLKSAQVGAKVIDYILDAKNNRVGKKVNGVLKQRFVYNAQGQIVSEVNEAAQVRMFSYATHVNSPSAMVVGSERYYFVLDHVGSVLMVVNTSTGTVVQELEYDAFGNVVKDTNPGFQPFGFAGGVYDQETQLVRFGARDYDPETGRWTSKDPILFYGGDTNLFGYVQNDPVNWIDPEGTTRKSGQVLQNDPFAGGGGGPPASAPVGRIGSIDMTAKGANCPTNIGGRNYSGHALDRMQGRGITPSVVENTIANGVPSMQSGGAIKLFDINNNVSVIINSSGNVITVFPGN